MATYLVTGRAGSGKSAVTAELQRRGQNAFDADMIPSLAAWHDRVSGEKVVIQDNSYVDTNKFTWRWDADILKDFLIKHTEVFICGGGANDLECAAMFDHCFVLNVSAAVQKQRLRGRTNNDYARNPRMHDLVVQWQRAHLKQAISQGSTAINADKPIEQVVSRILHHCHDNK